MIKIDKSEILPRVRRYSEQNHSDFADNTVGLADEVVDLAQEFFDSTPWESEPVELYDTKREMRTSCGAYVRSKIQVDDTEKSWFVPSFVWVWIANKIITWIIKLIIDRYWDDIIIELNVND